MRSGIFLALFSVGVAHAQDGYTTYSPYAAPPPQQQPAGYVPYGVSEVPVKFQPDGDGRYHVTIEERSCTTPCTLSLRPGSAPLHIDGGARRDETIIDLPARPARVELSYSSKGGYIAGPIALALGLAATGVGLDFAIDGKFDGNVPVGVVTAIVGVGAAVVGIVALARAGKIHAHVSAE
jgi:hypothetical protein